MEMTSRQRLLTALEGGIPDRLPVTTHHLQDYFRDTYMNSMNDIEIFDYFGMDAIHWTGPYLSPAEDNRPNCLALPHIILHACWVSRFASASTAEDSCIDG